MPNEYRRNGAPEHAKWKTTVDDYRGYTRAKLEDIHNVLERMDDRISNNRNNIEKNKKDISNIKTIAGIISFAITSLILLAKSILGGI